MFKSLFGISVDDAISALHGATQKLRDDFVSRCFPGVPFSAENGVELGFLAVYVVDDLVKNPQHPSWLNHREAVAKGYYSACAKGWAFGEFIFTMLYMPRMEQYNSALAEHLPELSTISDPRARFVLSAAVMGGVFADLCGHPDDKRYSLIGSGAVGLLHISTEKLFKAKLR
jgi:hypothetical protein